MPVELDPGTTASGPDRQTRVIGGDGTSVLSTALAPGLFQYVESILVQVDGGGAGGDVRPELSLATANGVVIATQRQGDPIPVGDTGSATFALRLGDKQRRGVDEVDSFDPDLIVFNPTGPLVSLARRTVYGEIVRDGAAPALNIATGALASTTTSIQHNAVFASAGITADIVSTPSRLVVVSAGMYLVKVEAAWANFAADFGVCSGAVTAATALVNPGITSRRVAGQTLAHQAYYFLSLNAGAIICQAAGQNSGAPIAAPIASLQAVRLGPKP